MFSNNHEIQKICIMESKLWRQKIINYINTNPNRIYYLNLIKNNKFIIRIYERNEFKRFQYFRHHIISKHPNLSIIFLLIEKRDLPLLNNEKKEIIDIEKKYDNNIYQKIFDKHIHFDFIKQLVYCQINLYANCGMVHNNIHEGNIFYEDNNDQLKFECFDKVHYVYNNGIIYYRNINKTTTSKIRFIISDFMKSKIYNSEYYCGVEECDCYEISLLKNLEDTMNLGKKMYNDDFIETINFDVPNILKDEYKFIFEKYILNQNIDYKKFNDETIKICWNYVSPILEKIEKNIEI